jgi:hypothetical protein
LPTRITLLMEPAMMRSSSLVRFAAGTVCVQAGRPAAGRAQPTSA